MVMKFGVSVCYEHLFSKTDFRENRLSESRTEPQGCGRIAILAFHSFVQLCEIQCKRICT